MNLDINKSNLKKQNCKINECFEKETLLNIKKEDTLNIKEEDNVDIEEEILGIDGITEECENFKVENIYIEEGFPEFSVQNEYESHTNNFTQNVSIKLCFIVDNFVTKIP